MKMSIARRFLSGGSLLSVAAVAACVASLGYVLLGLQLPRNPLISALLPIAWIVAIFSVFIVPAMALLSAVGAGMLWRVDPQAVKRYVVSLVLAVIWGWMTLFARSGWSPH